MSYDLKLMKKIGYITETESFIDVPIGLAAAPHLLGKEIDDGKLRDLGCKYMHVLGGMGGMSYTEWPNQSPKVDHGIVLRLIPDETYRDSDDSIVEGRFLGRREDIIEGPHERVFVITFGYGALESHMAKQFVRGMLESMVIQAERLKSPCSSFDYDKARRTIRLNVFNPTDLLGANSVL